VTYNNLATFNNAVISGNRNMSDLLIAENLHKSFYNGEKRLYVIKGIDISIKKGEILFIVGPSGAGKSTLLHLLAGLDRPDSGKVTLDGVDIYGLSDKKRSNLRNQNIGFVFQFYHLLPEFSAIENVMLPALMRRKDNSAELKKKASDFLSRLGLSDRVNHRPAELSGGEQQRVAIARALINSPDILFCDEPTGNLDSKNGEAIYELILNLSRKEGVTVLVVTHQKDYADRANRCLGIKDGILINNMI
jgi:lipoprotein releasing system ATP-binding protein